jgi:8-oxo-dGTP pyrophosphatase MutT (NUDIX family)
MPPPQPPHLFRVLCTGDWGPADVEARLVPSTRAVEPEVEALIEATWRDAVARPGVHLFDGPTCRLERWDVSPDGGRLRLSYSKSSYKAFFGTNMSHPDLADRFGPEVLANPIGVSPAVESADGLLLLGRRNQSLAYYPGRVHPFAGALEPSDSGDLFAAVRRELREELSLADAEVPEVRCTGLVYEWALRQTEFIFRARCALGREEIERRLDREEHGAVVAVPATEAGVAAAFLNPELTPVAVAALLMWRAGRFGHETYGDD